MKTRSPLMMLGLLVFIDLIGFGILLPIQPFFALHFDASDAQVTSVMGIYSVVQFLFAPFWGRLSDRIGRKPVLLISLFTSIISYVMIAMATSFTMLFIARIVSGIAAANIAAAMAYTADVTDRENRAKGMGLMGAAIGMGFVCGPILGAGGAHLGEMWGGETSRLIFIVPAIMAAVMSLVAFIGIWVVLPESLTPEARAAAAERRKSGPRMGMLLKMPQVSPALFIVLLMTLAFAMMELTFSLLADRKFDYGPKEVGMLMGVLGIAGVITQGGLVRRLVPKYGEPKLIAVGALILAAGLAPLAWVPNLGLFIVCCILMAVGAGFMQPSLNSHLSKICDESEKGSVLGVSQSMASLGRALPTWLSGRLFAENINYPYWLGAVLVVMCLLVALSLRRESN